MGFVAAASSYAQLPVSTSPENKNVVLEEFTGIKCVYCPDGHRRAAQFAAANPGDVVLINVHAGPFANPSAGQPDFTVPEGVAIDGISNVAGYPAGTINRRVFSNFSQNPGGLAMSRVDWASAGATVLGESSYVNIALEGDVDLATRTLTVDVELYFTGSAPDTVNLNVALMQDNIAGPQTGSSAYPAQVLPNGDYNHQHMLRDLITPQWGEEITATSMSNTVTKTYTYSIPNDIKGVPVVLGDLDIAGFVAEGQTDIITGAKGPLNYTAPSGAIIADLEASTNMSYPDDYCASTVTPEITVVNNSSQSVSNFEVSYSLNGGSPVTQTVSNTVNGQDSTTVTFSAVSVPAGINSLNYEVNTDANSNLYDVSTANNSTASEDIYIVPGNPFGTSHYEGFESYGALDETINNALLINNSSSYVAVLDNTVINSVSTPMGGFGQSAKSFLMQFYAMEADLEASLIFEKIDLSNTTGNALKFDYAYAQYDADSEDELQVNISDDCGETWTQVYSESGANLATAGTSSNQFFARPNDWAVQGVDLSQFDGSGEVIIEIRGVSDFGNNLYLDNIRLLNNTYVGLEENTLSSFQLYPNPAQDYLTLDIELQESEDLQVVLRDMAGKKVLDHEESNLSADQHQIRLDVNDLARGVYFLETKLGDRSKQEKLILD